jgi:Fic family protein
MSTEALTTSEIEGEILDRASVQSSIRRQLGLASDRRLARPREEGVAQMMVSLYATCEQRLTAGMLFEWHRMLMAGRRDMRDIGGYRTGTAPMQVVSGAVHAPRLHFEAPPSSRVPAEMKRLIDWYNRSELPRVTKAGLAHLYFESIHPFEDGNGRIGRAISEKALAQGLDQPVITSLATTILAKRKSYYQALEAANKSNEITSWLRWFAGVAIEAQRRTVAQVEFVIEKSRLLERLRSQLNARQEKALLRMLREGPEGFHGGLSAGNYASITGASPATATRDLADLVAKGALRREGELKYARYYLAILARPVSPVEI